MSEKNVSSICSSILFLRLFILAACQDQISDEVSYCHSLIHSFLMLLSLLPFVSSGHIQSMEAKDREELADECKEVDKSLMADLLSTTQ